MSRIYRHLIYFQFETDALQLEFDDEDTGKEMEINSKFDGRTIRTSHKNHTLISHNVLITEGPLKGYRGEIRSVTESTAIVALHANGLFVNTLTNGLWDS